MNDHILHEEMLKRVKPKFYGNERLICKAVARYPEGIEREYIRLTDAYVRLVNKTLKEYLPQIRAAARADREERRRLDSAGDLMAAIERAFSAAGIDLDKRMEEFGLRQKLEGLAHMTQKLSIKEWKREVSATLGIDLMDDYYLGEFYRRQLDAWVDGNVDLIKSIPKDTMAEMKVIVKEGFRGGRTITAILKDIQDTYGVKKRSARLIARDQLSKLNGELAKEQQQDAGVEEYIWRSVGDSRVRERHRELDGKRFRWDDPPIVDTKSGRRGHPGEDFQCRCIAIPVFNIKTIDLPMKGGG